MTRRAFYATLPRVVVRGIVERVDALPEDGETEVRGGMPPREDVMIRGDDGLRYHYRGPSIVWRKVHAGKPTHFSALAEPPVDGEVRIWRPAMRSL